MNEEPELKSNLPLEENVPSPRGGRLGCLVVALIPIPLQLLVAMADSSGAGMPSIVTVMMFIIGFVCCLFGGIGICGGFEDKARARSIVAGVGLGLVLGVLNLFVAGFIGCCTDFSHI
jgi:hypothetical protein